MKAKKRAELEAAAMREAKSILRQCGTVKNAMATAHWRLKVQRRAKEIIDRLGG